APYTTHHVVTQLQLLLFAILAVWVLVKTGLYPAELRATNLDSDWLYRRLAPRVVARSRALGGAALDTVARGVERGGRRALAAVYGRYGPEGPLAGEWPTGSMALWVAVLLVVAL